MSKYEPAMDGLLLLYNFIQKSMNQRTKKTQVRRKQPATTLSTDKKACTYYDTKDSYQINIANLNFRASQFSRTPRNDSFSKLSKSFVKTFLVSNFENFRADFFLLRVIFTLLSCILASLRKFIRKRYYYFHLRVTHIISQHFRN